MCTKQDNSSKPINQTVRQSNNQEQELATLLPTLNLLAQALTHSMGNILLSTSTLLILDVEPDSPLAKELANLMKHTWRMNELIDGINKLTNYDPEETDLK